MAKAKANTTAKQAAISQNDPNAPSSVQAAGAFSRAAGRKATKRAGRRKSGKRS
jgi:hypothetical protein